MPMRFERRREEVVKTAQGIGGVVEDPFNAAGDDRIDIVVNASRQELVFALESPVDRRRSQAKRRFEISGRHVVGAAEPKEVRRALQDFIELELGRSAHGSYLSSPVDQFVSRHYKNRQPPSNEQLAVKQMRHGRCEMPRQSIGEGLERVTDAELPLQSV